MSANLLPGGGYAYHYLADGTAQTQIAAPASFHPTTASDAALREYNYPP